jgi:hypothetical protein
VPSVERPVVYEGDRREAVERKLSSSQSSLDSPRGSGTQSLGIFPPRATTSTYASVSVPAMGLSTLET